MREAASGARLVAAIFKVFGALCALGTAATLFALHRADPGGVPTVAIASVVGGGLLAVAILLFFAYVLELLADIRDNSENLAQTAISAYPERAK